MKHLDLFSGIGGFAIAVDSVWPQSEHIFCDNDKFCQAVLKKHWPNAKIYGDIRTITNTANNGLDRCDTKSGMEGEKSKNIEQQWSRRAGWIEGCDWKPDLITGGFPCQPFSQAGKRRGTEDDRYLWPEMFRVIREFKPTWVIAENVRGLVTWNEGLVLEQVCTDLESEGYEVQPIIIPAVAVNAPHRRDRVWIIANNSIKGLEGGFEKWEGQHRQSHRVQQFKRESWNKNWLEVATELCSVDDGIPAELGDFTCTKAQHRNRQLKAYGNAIVPQVAAQIMQSIAYNQ
jgi:DNA (cytosine-5)-methyltransferase 1